MTRQELEKRLNDLYRHVGADRFFAPPHLKIADANDLWFGRFKEIIGPYHWTPQEALSRKFANSKALSVIVWILPVGLQARQANRLETIRPSTSWAEVRSFGELLNEELRSQLAALLTEGGFPSCAPHLDQREVYPPPGWDTTKFTSNWSERHVAFVAGAGTFGLSASLITEYGSAVRLGSVVTTLKLEPDIRPYGDDAFAWCTRCGCCIQRCPGHAIGKEFSDRDKPGCAMYCKTHIMTDRAQTYGWLNRALGCGLCQTAIPCEYQRPS